jgi:hypothetical protein
MSINIYILIVKIFTKKLYLYKKFIKKWLKKFQKFHELGPPKKVSFETKKLS